MKQKMTNMLSLKTELIKKAVSKLRKFGFTNVNEENITTDEVYSFYFFKMLKEWMGENQQKDTLIKQLLETMNKNITPKTMNTK